MKYITYLRVSTTRQSLGIDAQRALVKSHIQDQQGEHFAEFIEKESGRKVSDENRPQLHTALQLARNENAILLVAKVDRLARDLHFITALLKEEVPVQVAGHAQMSKIEWHLMGMIAEHEADLISLRTRQALQALRDKGVKLGAPPFKLARAQHLGGMATKDKAEAYRMRVSPILTGLLKDRNFVKINKRTRRKMPDLQAISDHLNGIGLRTMYNKPFNSESLRALMKKEKFI